MAITSQQKASLTKKAQNIQKAYDKQKNTLSSSDKAKISAGLNQAISGVQKLSGGGSSKKTKEAVTAPTITPESLKNTPTFTPPVQKVTDPGDLVGAGNDQLASLFSQAGLTKDTSGQLSVTPPPAGSAEEAVAQSNATLAGQIRGLLGAKQAPESQADIYAKEYKKQGVEKAQRQVNDYTGQINSIVANSQAQQLALEGQGRGQTSSFVGGEQARINREAAIAALPIQAQLSAAQGNLEFAQQQLNTMFNLKVADSKAKTDFWNGMVDSALGFATTAQQNVLNAKLSDINTRAQKEQANLALANQWAQMAVETGQSNLIGAFTSLDPKSPTFNADLGRLQAQVRKPVVATVAKRDTQFDPNGNLVDMQTGDIIREAGAVGGQEASQKSLDQFAFLKKSINEAKELADATGPNLITQGLGNVFVGNTRVKQLQNKLDSLKTNLLTLNTDPNVKKFFGPQMSNKDTELLLSAGSTLDAYSSSEQSNLQELVRYENLLNRMEKSVRDGLGQEQKTFQSNPNALPPSVLSQLQQPNIIYTPDGVEVEIID